MAYPVMPVNFPEWLGDPAADLLFRCLMITRLDRIDEVVLDDTASHFEGFSENKVLKAYAARIDCDIKFYNDKEGKHAAVSYKKGDMFAARVIASAVPALLSGWFKDKPLTDLERKAVIAITERNEMKLETLMTALYYTIDVQREVAKVICSRFAGKQAALRMKNAESKVKAIQVSIKRNVDTYAQLLRDLEESMAFLRGLQLNEQNDNNEELIDLFATNKNLFLIDSGDGYMNFVVQTKFKVFEPSLYHHNMIRKGTLLYTKEDVQLVFDKVFCEEPRFEIKAVAYFNFRMNDVCAGIDTRVNYNFGALGTDRVPNPHLNGYNCFGTAERGIIELINSSDLVGAVYACVSYAGTLNLSDTAPMEYFVQYIINHPTSKFFHDVETGEDLSLHEAIELMKGG